MPVLALPHGQDYRGPICNVKRQSSFDYGPGEALVITADVPTISEITEASPVASYYAVALELDISARSPPFRRCSSRSSCGSSRRAA